MKIKIAVATAMIAMVACNPAEKKEPATSTTPSEKATETRPDLVQLGMKESSDPHGLMVGDRVPAITYTTASDDEMKLEDLYRDQPLVVIFYRGYWCPACSKHLSEFAERAVEIEDAGAKIVAITPESYGNVDTTIARTGIEFTVISDVDGTLMKVFDVQFDVTEDYQSKVEKNYGTSLTENSATQDAVLPVPATFIIDTTGVVVYRQFNPDYKKRASMDEILSNLPD